MYVYNIECYQKRVCYNTKNFESKLFDTDNTIIIIVHKLNVNKDLIQSIRCHMTKAFLRRIYLNEQNFCTCTDTDCPHSFHICNTKRTNRQNLASADDHFPNDGITCAR